jgi:hypothetical protein
MKNLWAVAVAAVFLLASCSGGASDLSIVSKSLKSDANVSMAGAPDAGVSVPSSGSIYWVEGKVKNTGTEEVRSVLIAFRITDGNTRFVLTAHVPVVPPGGTADFRTNTEMSHAALRIIDEEPDITRER